MERLSDLTAKGYMLLCYDKIKSNKMIEEMNDKTYKRKGICIHS